MIQVPDEYIEKLTSPGRTFTGKLTVGDNDVPFAEFSKSVNLAPGDVFTIGNAISASFSAVIGGNISADLDGAEVTATISTLGLDFPQGIFLCDKPIKTGSLTTVTGSDRMSKADGVTYVSSLAYPASSTAVFAEIVDLLGYETITPSVEITIAEDKLSGYSCREALCYLSAFLGSNAVVGTDGKFRIVKYTTAALNIGASTIEEPDLTTYSATLNEIICFTDEENTITSGSGTRVMKIVCPIMTQARLDTIRTELFGTAQAAAVLTDYSPLKVTQLVGDPRIEPGDVCTLTLRDDTFKFPIMNYNLMFDGGLWLDLSAYDVGETERLNLAEKIDMAYRVSYKASNYAQAAAELSESIANSSGLYQTRIPIQGSADEVYYHDKATLAASTYIFTMTSEGFAWSEAWGGSKDSTTWTYGISKDGNAILRMLTAYKVSADIIEAGIIKSQTTGEDLLQYNLNDGSITLGGDDLNQDGKHFKIGKINNESQAMRFVRTASGVPVDYIAIGHDGITATYSLNPVFWLRNTGLTSFRTLNALGNGINFSLGATASKSLKGIQSGISASIASGLHTTTVNFEKDTDGNPLFQNVPNVTITPYRTGSWSYTPGTDRINFYISEVTTDHFTIVSDVTVAMRFQWLAVDYSAYTI